MSVFVACNNIYNNITICRRRLKRKSFAPLLSPHGPRRAKLPGNLVFGVVGCDKNTVRPLWVCVTGPRLQMSVKSGAKNHSEESWFRNKVVYETLLVLVQHG